MANIFYNNKYIQSSRIKVFPCAFRGASETAGQVDPEARLNSERNFTRYSKNLTRNAYIAKWVGDQLEVFINGYHFDIKLTLKELTDAGLRWAKIKLVTQKFDSNPDHTTTILGSFENNSVAAYLDPEIDGVQYFQGMLFSPNKGTVAVNEYAIDLRTDSSYFSIDTTAIESAVAGKAVTKNFIDGTAENSVKLGNTTTADKNNLVAIGTYNTTADGDLFVVGNGTSDAAKSNVLEVSTNNITANKPINGVTIKNTNDAVTLSTTSANATFNKDITVDSNVTLGEDGTGDIVIKAANNSTSTIIGAAGTTTLAKDLASGTTPHVNVQVYENNVLTNKWYDTTASVSATTESANANKILMTNAIGGISGKIAMAAFADTAGCDEANRNIGKTYVNSIKVSSYNGTDEAKITLSSPGNSSGKGGAEYSATLEKVHQAGVADAAKELTNDWYCGNLKLSKEQSIYTTPTFKNVSVRNTVIIGDAASIGTHIEVTNSEFKIVDGTLAKSQVVLNGNGLVKCNSVEVNSITASGTITAQTFNANSDARLKENISEYKPEKSILDLQVKKYDFINGKKNQIGCIAQELQQICPEIVDTDENGYLSIQESKLVYLLLDEVKKLKAEINELRGK